VPLELGDQAAARWPRSPGAPPRGTRWADWRRV